MGYWAEKIAIVTGASSGLGLAICQALARHEARVALVARDKDNLAAALQRLQGGESRHLAISGDITRGEEIARIVAETTERLGSPGLLVNCAGRSARGLAMETPPEEYEALWKLNFLAALEFTKACLPGLIENRGHVIHVGSLAAKLTSRFLGAYPASKFPLAALSQQMRLELSEKGLHTLLVCPGPIKRDDAGERYAAQSESLPDSAGKPGAGVKVAGIDPDWLAEKILSACERRKAELIVPRKARLAIILSAVSPRLGDWLIRTMTR